MLAAENRQENDLNSNFKDYCFKIWFNSAKGSFTSF